MSTAADIWEVMAEEIAAHPRDRLEAFRGRNLSFNASITYGSTGANEVLAAAKTDPDNTEVKDAETELTAACTRYDVTAEEVRNTQLRHTAVVAARASVATRLSAVGWSGVAIGKFLFGKRTGMSHMLRGGRGKGVLPSSRITKDLVARRASTPPPRPPPMRSAGNGNRGRRRIEQAAWALRHLRDAGEELLIHRLVTKHYPELSVQQVYNAAFGPDLAPVTLEEARVAETQGEGVVRFVGGVPKWFSSVPSPPPRTLLDRVVPLDSATPVESHPPHAR